MNINLKNFFIIISLIIILLGILNYLNSSYIYTIIGIIIFIFTTIILNKNSSKFTKLSSENIKIKTFKNLTIFNIIFIILIIILNEIFLKFFPNFKNLQQVLTIIISVYILYFGNLAPKIPFNRYLGLRLPWTIRDEQTFKLAHKILGYLSFPIGIFLILTSHLHSKNIIVICIIIWLFIPSLISAIYYFNKFKQK